MTGEDFRAIALSLEGAIERAHMGHPDFRANGRIFATLQADERRGMVKVSPDEQRELLRTHAGAFVPAAGAWGRQGCTMVQLDAVDRATVRGALMLAWEHAVALPAGPPARKGRKRPPRPPRG
jgi:predicted DNA-binding protein (MmcQ/YjbR family)